MAAREVVRLKWWAAVLSKAILIGKSGIRLLLWRPRQLWPALAAIGVAVAVCTAVLTVSFGVLLRALPYKQSERLVELRDAKQGWLHGAVSSRQYRVVGSEATTLEALAVWSSLKVLLESAGEADFTRGAAVSPNLFSVLGVSARAGRGLRTGDDRAGAPAPIVLSHKIWERRFGGDWSVVGRIVQLDGVGHRVVGVMPRGFFFPTAQEEFWIPAPWLVHPGLDWEAQAIGRLKQGVTPSQARSEVQNLLRSQGMDWAAVSVTPIQSVRLSRVKSLLAVLLGAAGIVWLIATLNASAVLRAHSLQRAARRSLEHALGAGHAWLVCAECVYLLCAAAVAVLVALPLVSIVFKVAVWVQPSVLQGFDHLAVTSSTVLLAGGIALVTALLAGMPGLRHGMRVARESASAAGLGGGRLLTRRPVVGALVLAVQMGVTSGLLAQISVFAWRLQKTAFADIGVATSGMMTVRVRLPNEAFRTAWQEADFCQNLLRELEGAAGVNGRHVAISNCLPLTDEEELISTRRADVPFLDALKPMVGLRIVSPGYFRTVGARVLAGTVFDGSETPGTGRVAVVTDNLARYLFNDQNPVGQRLSVMMRQWTIVGVVPGSRPTLQSDPRMEVFLPYTQVPTAHNPDGLMKNMWLLFRSQDGDGRGFIPLVRATASGLHTGVVLSEASTMEDRVYASLADRIVAVTAGAVLAMVALVLAGVGLYAAFNEAVIGRRREIAIRAALGAAPPRLVWDTVRAPVGAVCAGLVLGLVLAWMLNEVSPALVLGMAPALAGERVKVFAMAAALLGAVASTAALLPARKALQVPPSELLRSE